MKRFLLPVIGDDAPSQLILLQLTDTDVDLIKATSATVKQQGFISASLAISRFNGSPLLINPMAPDHASDELENVYNLGATEGVEVTPAQFKYLDETGSPFGLRVTSITVLGSYAYAKVEYKHGGGQTWEVRSINLEEL